MMREKSKVEMMREESSVEMMREKRRERRVKWK